MGMRPVVIAAPSLMSIEMRMKRELEEREEDISKYFDPTKGLHKVKSTRTI